MPKTAEKKGKGRPRSAPGTPRTPAKPTPKKAATSAKKKKSTVAAKSASKSPARGRSRSRTPSRKPSPSKKSGVTSPRVAASGSKSAKRSNDEPDRSTKRTRTTPSRVASAAAATPSGRRTRQSHPVLTPPPSPTQNVARSAHSEAGQQSSWSSWCVIS